MIDPKIKNLVFMTTYNIEHYCLFYINSDYNIYSFIKKKDQLSSDKYITYNRASRFIRSNKAKIIKENVFSKEEASQIIKDIINTRNIFQ